MYHSNLGLKAVLEKKWGIIQNDNMGLEVVMEFNVMATWGSVYRWVGQIGCTVVACNCSQPCGR